ncbi:hypothetical protein C3L33_23016, partial [Rhododendron williamsianum]
MQRRCENNLAGQQCLSYGRQTVQPQRISDMVGTWSGLMVELEKQSYCDLKVANNTEHCVAFKVKTTSPKKYFVRPNTGVIQPWDSCFIRGQYVHIVHPNPASSGLYFVNRIYMFIVGKLGLQDMLTYAKVSKRSVHVAWLSRARVPVTLQAQREYPLDMQSKDKFLLQSTIVASHTEVDELPQDTFTKDSGKVVEECKLRVVYLSPQAALGNSEDEASKDSKRNLDSNSVSSTIALLYLSSVSAGGVVPSSPEVEEEMLKRRRDRKIDAGFSFKFSVLVGLIGIMVGFLLKFSLSSPSTE